MATLERGKGKRKQVMEIVRHGSVLCRRETDAGNARLPGYRRFVNEAAASAGLAAEVRAHLADGMQPADDEARALASVQEKPKGPPTLPLRQDLGIYNEATGFVVTSRKMAGKTLEEGSPDWKKAVTRGDMLPLMLVQDDPFVIRVVAGEPLTAQEEEEWIARVDWHLNVSDGNLCVTGGSVFTNEGYDKDDPYHEEYVGQVALPKGRYRAALYTFVHGVNGGSVMDYLTGGHDKGEALDSWLARTRPGETFPASDDIAFVDFLLHLEPIAAAPKSGLSVLPDDGWFNGAENPRKPERCPLGIVGHEIVRRLGEGASGKWTFVRNVFEHLPPLDRKIVKGDAVSLPLDSLARAARIAWFASRFTVIELRLTPLAGSSIQLDGAWPEGIIAVQEEGVVRFLFDADLDMSTSLKRLPELADRLAAMPEGTVLDLCTHALEFLPGTPEGTGLLSLRGVIRNGAWRISQAYPEVDASTLAAALSLAAEIEQGATISMRDEAEGNSILSRAKRNFGKHLKGNPELLGIAAFAERFSRVWPVANLTAQEDEGDDDEGDGLFPAKPIRGAEIFVAPSGRAFHQTMAMLVSEKVGSEIPKRERGLFSSGFKHVGDVVCDAFENVGVRGYARPGGDAWAFFRVSAPASIELVIFAASAENDTVLITSTDPDNAAANAKELVALHDGSRQELAAQLGTCRLAVLNMRGFAEAYESFLLKS
jgi:hypothetical protein